MVEDDLKKALGNFLTTRLKLDRDILLDMEEIAIKRVAAGPRAKIRGEIIAVFSSVAVRDAVKGAAKELAGLPDAGIRLEIPYSLQSNLKALEAVSYNLKRKLPDLKRNVRFDDEEMDLVLHFSTNRYDRDPWRKVRPAQAKLMKEKIIRPGRGGAKEVTDGDLEKMMEDSGSSGPDDGNPS